MDSAGQKPAWAPSPEQARFFEWLTENGFGGSKEELCQRAGVARRTLYHWLESPDFREAFEGLLRRSTDGDWPGILQAQVKASLQGDTKAATFVAKVTGRLNDKVELSAGKGGLVIMLPPEGSE